MKLKLLLSTIIVSALLAGTPLLAQHTVKGNVNDTDGTPLVGVTVLEQGTSNGTVTDALGDYTLDVSSPEATLLFRYVGLESKLEPINGRSTIDVTMLDDAEVLDQVVVTALGFEENEDEVGYASSTVDGSTVVQAAEPTVINSLQGRASGVRISRNSGDPGAGAYIQIRGISTIDRDAQPLIVVDGVPISNASRGPQENLAAQSRLNDINPNDIESVTVLKGASAAALWGTRALGGVIIIKTKGGQYNKPLSVNYKSSYSVDQINRRYPKQTTFGQGDNGVYNQRARDSWGDKITDRPGGQDEFDTSGEFYVGQEGNIYYPVVSKNSQETFDESNFDQVFQNGHFWENSLSISGGNANSTIFASLSDMNQEGIIRSNSDYRRTTARVNVSHRITDNVKLKASATYAKSKSNRIRRGASSSGLHLGLLRTPADFDNTGYRGEYFAGPDAAPVFNRHRSYREPLGADGSATYNNPAWTINEQEALVDVDRFITSAELTASPTSWLDLIGRVGLDKFAELQQNFFTPGSAAGAFRQGRFQKELARNTVFNMDYIAKAGGSFGPNFSGSMLVGFNYNNRELIVDGSSISNFIQFFDVDSGVRDIDNALPENTEVTSTFGQERTVGVYSSATLNAYDQLFINGTLRAESASTFGSEADNTFLFPSASVAWQFTEVPAFSEGFLSFGKLRFSYGEVGVQPARYNTTNIFIAPNYSDEYGGSLDGGLFGDGSFVPSSQRGSASLRPERKKEFEIGTDLRFYNDRITLNATYFNNTTEDVLLDFPIANSRGVTRLYTNGAEIQNDGWEVDLQYNILKNKNWYWNVGAIYSEVNNEVTRLDEGLSIILGGLSAVNARTLLGFPIGVLWGSRTLRDDNGDIVFDENGFPVQDQLEGVIGDPNPDWQGSLYSTLTYKNFTLSVLFETLQGSDIFAGTKSVMTDLGTWGDTDQESTASQNLLTYDGDVILAGETFRGKVHNFGAGPVALTESWYNGDGGFFSGGNDELYIEDGSWTRLREISLSYTAQSDWLKRNTGIGSAQFTVTGRNLIIWTAFEGNDPDTNLSGVSKARGIDYFNNPATQSYVFTLNLNF
ncbi:MAG: SusC/RagA family TonB-linked outer membrane protein [Bacteroidetes bacterium]|jgi:TonB-linked SusC/RagA family outer membrane protein|nr:SusC/RagA family TonB-linked outer membrane protein [Bacteroidota bacterium]